MVSGGCDRAIRLWSPLVSTHPIAALRGHWSAVLDVTIYPPARQFFSYSRDAVSGKKEKRKAELVLTKNLQLI